MEEDPFADIAKSRALRGQNDNSVDVDFSPDLNADDVSNLKLLAGLNLSDGASLTDLDSEKKDVVIQQQAR